MAIAVSLLLMTYCLFDLRLTQNHIKLWKRLRLVRICSVAARLDAYWVSIGYGFVARALLGCVRTEVIWFVPLRFLSSGMTVTCEGN